MKGGPRRRPTQRNTKLSGFVPPRRPKPQRFASAKKVCGQFDDPRSKFQSFDDPRSEFQNFHDPRDEFFNHDNPRNEPEDFDDPRSVLFNEKKFDDPRSEFQNFRDPRDEFLNDDDPRSVLFKKKFDDPRYEFQNFHDPRNEFLDNDDPRSALLKKKFDDPRDEFQNFRDPRDEFLNHDGPRSKFKNFDDLRGKFRDPRDEFLNHDDPRSEFKSFDDPRSKFLDPRDEFLNHDDPRSEFKSFGDPRSKFCDPRDELLNNDDPRSVLFKNKFDDPRSEFQNFRDPRDEFLNHDDPDDPRSALLKKFDDPRSKLSNRGAPLSKLQNFHDPRSEFEDPRFPRTNLENFDDDPRPFVGPLDDSQASEDPRPFSLPSEKDERPPPKQVPSRVPPAKDDARLFPSRVLPSSQVPEECAPLPGKITPRPSAKNLKRKQLVGKQGLAKPPPKQARFGGAAESRGPAVPLRQQTSWQNDQYHPNDGKTSISSNLTSKNQSSMVGNNKTPPVHNRKPINQSKAKKCFELFDNMVETPSVTNSDSNTRTVVEPEKTIQKRLSRSRDRRARTPSRSSAERRARSRTRRQSRPRNSDRSPDAKRESRSRSRIRSRSRTKSRTRSRARSRRSRHDKHRSRSRSRRRWSRRRSRDRSGSSEEDVREKEEKWRPKKCSCTFKHDLAIVTMKLRNELIRLERLLKSSLSSEQRWGLMTFINEVKYQLSEPESTDIITGKCDRVEPYTCKEELQRKFVKLKLLLLIHNSEEERRWLRSETRKVKRGLFKLQLQQDNDAGTEQLSSGEQSETPSKSNSFWELQERILKETYENVKKINLKPDVMESREDVATSRLIQTKQKVVKQFPNREYPEVYSKNRLDLEEGKLNTFREFQDDAINRLSQANPNLVKQFPNRGYSETYSKNPVEGQSNNFREFQDDAIRRLSQTNPNLVKQFPNKGYPGTYSKNPVDLEEKQSNTFREFQDDAISRLSQTNPNLVEQFPNRGYPGTYSKNPVDLDEGQSNTFREFQDDAINRLSQTMPNLAKQFPNRGYPEIYSKNRVDLEEGKSIPSREARNDATSRLSQTEANILKYFLSKYPEIYSENRNNFEEEEQLNSFREFRDDATTSTSAQTRANSSKYFLDKGCPEMLSKSRGDFEGAKSNSFREFREDTSSAPPCQTNTTYFPNQGRSEIGSKNTDNVEEERLNPFRQFRDDVARRLNQTKKYLPNAEYPDVYSRNRDDFEGERSNPFGELPDTRQRNAYLKKGFQTAQYTEMSASRNDDHFEQPETNYVDKFRDNTTSYQSMGTRVRKYVHKVECTEIISSKEDSPNQPESTSLRNFRNEGSGPSRMMNPANLEKRHFQGAQSSEFSRNLNNLEEPQSNSPINSNDAQSNLSRWMSTNLEKLVKKIITSEMLPRNNNDNFEEPESNRTRMTNNSNLEDYLQGMGSLEFFSRNCDSNSPKPASNPRSNIRDERNNVSRLTNPNLETEGFQRTRPSQTFSRQIDNSLEEPQPNRFQSFPNDRNMGTFASMNPNLEAGFRRMMEDNENLKELEFRNESGNVSRLTNPNLQKQVQRVGPSEISSRNNNSLEELESSNRFTSLPNEKKMTFASMNQNLEEGFRRMMECSETFSKNNENWEEPEANCARNFRNESGNLSRVTNPNLQKQVQKVGPPEKSTLDSRTNVHDLNQNIEVRNQRTQPSEMVSKNVERSKEPAPKSSGNVHPEKDSVPRLTNTNPGTESSETFSGKQENVEKFESNPSTKLIRWKTANRGRGVSRGTNPPHRGRMTNVQRGPRGNRARAGRSRGRPLPRTRGSQPPGWIN